MAVWGIYDKINHEFARHYELYYDDTIETAEPREGWRLFKYESELEAELEHQDRFHGYHQYEVIELPADEPEWVF